MSFDEQLRPAFENLTTRLRSDLERHIDAAVQELSEHAAKIAQAAESGRANELSEAVREARAEAERGAVEQHRVAMAEAEARFASQAGEADDRHREALRDADDRHREALKATDEQLQHVLAAHKGQLDSVTNESDAQLERRLAEAQSRTIQNLQAAELTSGQRLVDAFRAIDAGQSLSDILDTLANAVAAEANRSVIFLTGNDQVKGWRLHGFDPAIGPLDVPIADGGIIASAIASRATAWAGTDHDGMPPMFAALSNERVAVAVPMTVSDEVVAVIYADQGPSGGIERVSWASAVELLARHASRSLEAITAHRLVETLGSRSTRPRTVSKPADVVLSVRSSQPLARESESVAVFDEASASAQRYAYTLMAEIRHSHEADVLAGLHHRDLITRLSGPIARAWGQYEARVPESIRAVTNYFHAEMIRTLADGDASLVSPKP